MNKTLNTIFLGICAAALVASNYFNYQQIKLYRHQLQLMSNSPISVTVPSSNQQYQDTNPSVPDQSDQSDVHPLSDNTHI